MRAENKKRIAIFAALVLATTASASVDLGIDVLISARGRIFFAGRHGASSISSTRFTGAIRSARKSNAEFHPRASLHRGKTMCEISGGNVRRICFIAELPKR
jgi:hypothetical protein